MNNSKNTSRKIRRPKKNECTQETKKTTFNDPSWYASSAQLLKDSASLSFNNPTGVKIDVGMDYLGNTTKWPGGHSAPGVMALTAWLCPGISKDNSSAVNIAARNIYSFVRHANSGHANYDAPDLMLYLLAMDNIYALYNWCKRLYGVMSSYSVYNRYQPEALVTAMGANFDDYLEHIADLRFYINSLCNKINTLAVPSVMPYFVRHSWLFSNIYTDGESEKAQAYLFKPRGFYKYVETEGQGKLNLLLLDVSTFDKLRAYFNEILAAVVESEDMNIMSGDIRKAYGDSGLFTVTEVAEGYTIAPVYNEEVLSQIHNSTILGSNTSANNITVTIDTNTIIWNPNFKAPSAGWSGNRILNMNKQNVEPADVMVATRLMNSVINEQTTPEDPAHVSFNLESCGSEVLTGATIYYYGYNSSNTWSLQTLNFDSVLMFQEEAGVEFAMAELALIEKFDWHPCIWLTAHHGTASSIVMQNVDYVSFAFDLDNYTVVDNLTLGKMHDTAILSEFGISSQW